MITQALSGGCERLKAHICLRNSASEKREYTPSAQIFQVCVMPQLCNFIDMSLAGLLRLTRNHCTSAPFILYLYIYYYVEYGAHGGAVGVQ